MTKIDLLPLPAPTWAARTAKRIRAYFRHDPKTCPLCKRRSPWVS